jgi:uncharacterized protein (TIGR03435 family)
MPQGTFTPQQGVLMIQSLLADRFELKTHREMREIPVYSMVYAKSDKKPGPSLHAATLDCAEVRASRNGRGPTSPEEMMQCNFLTSNLPGGVKRVQAQAVSLANLTAVLGTFVDRPIFDRTGSNGNYDLDLTFIAQVGGPPPGDAGDAPFIFNAIQEQLALKLEPTRSSVEMLVVDRISRPTEN